MLMSIIFGFGGMFNSAVSGLGACVRGAFEFWHSGVSANTRRLRRLKQPVVARTNP